MRTWGVSTNINILKRGGVLYVFKFISSLYYIRQHCTFINSLLLCKKYKE
jgi:hypothetical protein